MIIYNVTLKVEHAIHDEWLSWMKKTHIPDVLKTGHFLDANIYKILVDEEDGVSYSFQYLCQNMEEYEAYKNNHAPRLQKEVIDKYAGRFVAFRTLLEKI